MEKQSVRTRELSLTPLAVLNARKAGFRTTVVEDACRAIDLNGLLAAA